MEVWCCVVVFFCCFVLFLVKAFFFLSFPFGFCSNMCKLCFHFMKVCHEFCLCFQNALTLVSASGKWMYFLFCIHSPDVVEYQESSKPKSKAPHIGPQVNLLRYINGAAISVCNVKRGRPMLNGFWKGKISYSGWAQAEVYQNEDINTDWRWT